MIFLKKGKNLKREILILLLIMQIEQSTQSLFLAKKSFQDFSKTFQKFEEKQEYELSKIKELTERKKRFFLDTELINALKNKYFKVAHYLVNLPYFTFRNVDILCEALELSATSGIDIIDKILIQAARLLEKTKIKHFWDTAIGNPKRINQNIFQKIVTYLGLAADLAIVNRHEDIALKILQSNFAKSISVQWLAVILREAIYFENEEIVLLLTKHNNFTDIPFDHYALVKMAYEKSNFNIIKFLLNAFSDDQLQHLIAGIILYKNEQLLEAIVKVVENVAHRNKLEILSLSSTKSLPVNLKKAKTSN